LWSRFSGPREQRTGRFESFVLLCLSFLSALVLYLLCSRDLGTWILWDADVYARALHRSQEGQNPYNLSDPLLLFVYPPVLLYVGSIFSQILHADIGSILYVIAFAASSLALPFLPARHYLARPWLTLPLAYVLAAMEPRFAWLGAVRAGNITNIFYFVGLAAAVPGIRKNRWTYFYLVL
jgi:hypothetical protein